MGCVVRALGGGVCVKKTPQTLGLPSTKRL